MGLHEHGGYLSLSGGLSAVRRNMGALRNPISSGIGFVSGLSCRLRRRGSLRRGGLRLHVQLRQQRVQVLVLASSLWTPLALLLLLLAAAFCSILGRSGLCLCSGCRGSVCLRCGGTIDRGSGRSSRAVELCEQRIQVLILRGLGSCGRFAFLLLFAALLCLFRCCLGRIELRQQVIDLFRIRLTRPAGRIAISAIPCSKKCIKWSITHCRNPVASKTMHSASAKTHRAR